MKALLLSARFWNRYSFSFEFVKSVSTGEGRPSLLVKDSDNSDTSLGFLKNSTAKIGRITTSLLFNLGFLKSVSWPFWDPSLVISHWKQLSNLWWIWMPNLMNKGHSIKVGFLIHRKSNLRWIFDEPIQVVGCCGFDSFDEPGSHGMENPLHAISGFPHGLESCEKG